MSTLPPPEPARFTSLHRPKHPMLPEDGDDDVDGQVVPIFEAATKQGKGSRTGYIPWAACFCTIPRPKMDELVTHAEIQTWEPHLQENAPP
jgi:hypothetical protein